MSATQAENKQTTNHSPGTWWWQEARFPAPPWQSLRQEFCVSKEETEATRGTTPYPEHPFFVLSYCFQAQAPSFPLLGPQFPHLSKGEFRAPCLWLCYAPCQVFPLPALSRKQRMVLVVCGPEQNGAVGLVCARHLRMFVSSKDPLGLQGHTLTPSQQK